MGASYSSADLMAALKRRKKKKGKKRMKVVSYWLSQSSTPLSLLYSLEHDDMHKVF